MSETFMDGLEILGHLPESRIKLVVLILSYNQDKFLKDAVESVLNQDYSGDFSIVIHDDASTDKSREIIERLIQSNPQRIIGLLQRKNKFSLGVNILEEVHILTPSEYVARLDADDLWVSRNKLAVQVKFLENNPDVSISAHSVIVLDEVRNLLSVDLMRNTGFISPNKFAFCNFLSTASIMYRVDLVAPLPKSFTAYYIQDWPLWSILANRGRVYFHDDLISIYRIHKANGFARKANSLFIVDTLAINQMIAHFLKVNFISFWNLTFVLRRFFSILDRFSFYKASTVLNFFFNSIVGIRRVQISASMSTEYLQIFKGDKLQTSLFPVNVKAKKWLHLNE